MMKPFVSREVYLTNNSVKDIDCWTTYTNVLFFVVKFYIEPARQLK